MHAPSTRAFMGAVAILLLAAASARSAQRAPGMGVIAGDVVFSRHDSGTVVEVVRCVQRSPPRPPSDACPAGTPQWVGRAVLRPGESRFSFTVKPGRYRIEDQLAKHSTPFGCIDATHTVEVRADHTTHLTLNTAIPNAGCGNTY